MKTKFYKFLTLITVISAIFIGVSIYYNISKFEMITWQSKALIEQVKPLVIEAEGKRAIDYAVANSVYTNNLVTLLAFILPYLAIGIFALYKLSKLGVMLYAQIRSANHTTTNK